MNLQNRRKIAIQLLGIALVIAWSFQFPKTSALFFFAYSLLFAGLRLRTSSTESLAFGLLAIGSIIPALPVHNIPLIITQYVLSIQGAVVLAWRSKRRKEADSSPS